MKTATVQIGGIQENYYPGDRVVISAQFNDTNGSAANAADVVFATYCPNSGAPAVYVHGQTAANLNGQTGLYFITFVLPAEAVQYLGSWVVKVIGTCDGQTPAASSGFAYHQATSVVTPQPDPTWKWVNRHPYGVVLNDWNGIPETFAPGDDTLYEHFDQYGVLTKELQ